MLRCSHAAPFWCCSGGLSNLLYLCTIPAHVPCVAEEPRQVLLRIYGAILQVGLSCSSVFFLLFCKTLSKCVCVCDPCIGGGLLGVGECDVCHSGRTNSGSKTLWHLSRGTLGTVHSGNKYIRMYLLNGCIKGCIY